MYAVVLAGGSGTRLWPRSRGATPKHLLNLLRPEATMLQETVTRILPVVDPEQVFVVTNARHTETVRAQLPEVPSANVLGEPVGRNSAPAIGYAALHIYKREPDAVMLLLPADHVIRNVDRFHSAIRSGVKVAVEGRLVTLGITPSHPETGYGYMELGEEMQQVDGHTTRRVVRFTEKPDIERATEYVHSGQFVWNSGMFIWTPRAILDEMSRFMPALYDGLIELSKSVDTSDETVEMDRLWPNLPNQSIDYGVLERSQNVVTIPVDIGWSDVGDWATLADFSARDEEGNAVVGDAKVLDSTNSLVYSSDRLVTAIGLEDMVVVDTGDAVLVCPKSRAQDVKRLVDTLRAEGRLSLL